MDAWLYICRLHIIGALFEYAYLLRRVKKATSKAAATVLTKNKGGKGAKEDTKRSLNHRCNRIDEIAFVAFLAIFGTFCVVYLIVCTRIAV
jgi:hypothetical protein